MDTDVPPSPRTAPQDCVLYLPEWLLLAITLAPLMGLGTFITCWFLNENAAPYKAWDDIDTNGGEDEPCCDDASMRQGFEGVAISLAALMALGTFLTIWVTREKYEGPVRSRL